MTSTFDSIRADGRVLYEYTRGSTLYNLNTPDSDIDTSAIYIAKPEQYLGFLNYEPQISDEKHDNTWFEIGNFLELAMKSNPTVLEALFVPNNKIIGEVHPYMLPILENRNLFISKQCFNPFFGYAKSQIEKARGLNKKIVNPIVERKTIMDFIFTFKNQGSTKILNWLEDRGLYQKYCGLVNIPNMHDIYGVYYDYGMHVAEKGISYKFAAYVYTLLHNETPFVYNITFSDNQINEAKEWLSKQKVIGYRGIITENASTTEVRLSSIDDKNDKPICNISYNVTGFTSHCKKYKEYKEWERNRNPKRYESNLNKNYDSKNMMHCFRMIHMAKEIAEGKGIILERDWDHDFLMKVRNHEYEYDELMEMLTQDADEMNRLMEISTIQESVPVEYINSLLIDIRKKQLGIYR